MISAGAADHFSQVLTHPRLKKWPESQVRGLPRPLQTKVAQRYAQQYSRTLAKSTAPEHQKQNHAYKAANLFLRKRLTPLYKQLKTIATPYSELLNAECITRISNQSVKDCLQKVTDLAQKDTGNYSQMLCIAYGALAHICQGRGIRAPFDTIEHMQNEHFEIAIKKMLCEKWWQRKLKRYRAHAIEAVEIAAGNVSKQAAPYCSRFALGEFIQQQKKNQRYIDSMQLEDENGEIIDLKAAIDASVANPANRRAELMLRVRSIEEHAIDIGFTGFFYTLTAPAKYHVNSNKWDGATPKDTQKYFTDVWARTRAQLNRLNIEYFGIRVVEPHADSTPHWHMMLFVSPENARRFNQVIRWHFCQQDIEELLKRRERQASKKRFKAYKKARSAWGLAKSKKQKASKPQPLHGIFAPRYMAVKLDMDGENGRSAAAYIAKYISKNIDGFALGDDKDHETGKALLDSVSPVTAWSRLWNIPQFHFQGSPSVTVYRELRRQREEIQTPEIEHIRAAADSGDFKTFIDLMGGMCAGKNQTLKTKWQDKDQPNKYREIIKTIKGVFVSADPKIDLLTRTKTWLLKQKQAEGAQGGKAALSWTCGNNCTQGEKQGATLHQQVKNLGFSPPRIDGLVKNLLRGLPITHDGREKYRLINNVLTLQRGRL
jgi:ribosomal protein L22